jgi:hypothetical protein
LCCYSIIKWENENMETCVKNLISLDKDLQIPFNFMLKSFNEMKAFKKIINFICLLKEFSEKSGKDSIYQQFKTNIVERVLKSPSAYSLDNLIEYLILDLLNMIF